MGKKQLRAFNSALCPADAGFGLVGVIVGITIIAVALAVLFGVAFVAWRVSYNAQQKVQAGFLLEEGAEAMRLLRDKSWDDNIKNNSGDFCVDLSGSDFTITQRVSSCLRIDDTFERWVAIGDAKRDGSGKLVQSGGTSDPNTRYVTVNVSWQDRSGTTKTKTLSFYLMKLSLP